ncbi:Putative diguanylate cyclase/phosphodiesterase (GGDEF & EAL domains) with PAS/PAC and GAF sensor(s) [Marinobacter sp. ELB17]|nr:Putative diguanylate cyclase/phosphodiesterase (GGDEF & EAL domains) with PAS/PAC and GAF sensor(s) [Marinobacter sp. ELB17]
MFLLLALGLRFGQSQQDSRQIQAHLDTEAEIMAISEAQWRRDVRNHLQDSKIYQAIEWIDRDFSIRWIEPQLGVRLAIDNVGVGYSSLSYIRDFPIDLLKIDRSFITQVTERQDDATITSAIINLAHNLGIQVVAEGVETISKLNFLRQRGCAVAQGYLISRPIPADQLEQWLKPQHAENLL